eukprot:2919186-Rhodomonas_salina.1
METFLVVDDRTPWRQALDKFRVSAPPRLRFPLLLEKFRVSARCAETLTCRYTDGETLRPTDMETWRHTDVQWMQGADGDAVAQSNGSRSNPSLISCDDGGDGCDVGCDCAADVGSITVGTSMCNAGFRCVCNAGTSLCSAGTDVCSARTSVMAAEDAHRDSHLDAHLEDGTTSSAIPYAPPLPP